MRSIGILVIFALLLPQSVEASSLKKRVQERRQMRLMRSPRRHTVRRTGTVTRVIDGSVIHVKVPSGDIETVRTLGSEAPLLQTGSKKQQCFAEEAKNALATMLLGKEVYLRKDDFVRKDSKGRLLRYVYRDTLDINGWMLWNGYTFVDKNNTYERRLDYIDRERDSRKNNRGLWSAVCGYHPNPEIQFTTIK